MEYPFQEVPEGVRQIAKPHREILDPPPNGNVRTMKFMHDSEQYYRSPRESCIVAQNWIYLVSTISNEY